MEGITRVRVLTRAWLRRCSDDRCGSESCPACHTRSRACRAEPCTVGDCEGVRSSLDSGIRTLGTHQVVLLAREAHVGREGLVDAAGGALEAIDRHARQVRGRLEVGLAVEIRGGGVSWGTWERRWLHAPGNRSTWWRWEDGTRAGRGAGLQCTETANEDGEANAREEADAVAVERANAVERERFCCSGPSRTERDPRWDRGASGRRCCCRTGRRILRKGADDSGPEGTLDGGTGRLVI